MIPSGPITVDCAWCGVRLVQGPDEDGPISHGACEPCAAEFERQLVNYGFDEAVDAAYDRQQDDRHEEGD